MNELENKMIRNETEYSLNDDEYDSYINSLAERDDKNYDENI